jgi:hypothetical protein
LGALGTVSIASMPARVHSLLFIDQRFGNALHIIGGRKFEEKLKAIRVNFTGKDRIFRICWTHYYSENFKVMDATKSMDRKEEGKEEEKGRKEGRKGGKGERKVLGGVWDGHVCLTLSDDG